MARFRYTAYDEAGSRVAATIDGRDVQEVKQRLNASGFVPISIEPEQGIGQSRTTARRPLTLAECEFLTAELALLLRNGVRIDRALEILGRGTAATPLGYIIEALTEDVRHGKSIADAFAQHPGSFDPLFINLVRLGESTASLPAIFSRLAETLQFRHRIAGQIRHALTYPTFILVVCIGVLLFVFNFIVPRLTVMFEGMEQLPIYTEILLKLTDVITRYQYHIGAALVLLGIALRAWVRQGHGRAMLGQLIIGLPLIGHQLRLLERLRYASALSLLLREGVVIDEAMRLASGSVRNPGMMASLESARDMVKRGQSLHQSLIQTELFPDAMIGMIEVGEESGNLSHIFTEITARSSDEFEAMVRRLTTLLEPILILFMGLIVGSVVVVMLMSIVSIEDIGL